MASSPSKMPLFLDSVQATEDGYLWIKSQTSQEAHPPLLPRAETLWNQLHAPLNQEYPTRQQNVAPFQLVELQRTRGLMESIRLTLLDIEHMKDSKNDKSMRLSVNRLKKQQTARLNQASPEALHIVEEQAYLDATVRSIKTLNSIRALFPLLIAMFHQEETRNQELELTVKRNELGVVVETTTLEKLNQGEKKQKKVRSSQKLVWLIGDYVYDTCRAGHFKALNENLCRIFATLFPDKQLKQDTKDMRNIFWNRLLYDFVQDQTVRRQVPTPNKLFASLSLEKQVQAHKIAEACDDKYLNVFHHENVESQETRSLYQASVDKLTNNLRMVIQKRFRGCEVRVYGSCLSNLALGKSSDVDLSLHLPAFAQLKHLFETGEIEAKKYEKDVQTYVYRISNLLSHESQSSNGFRITGCVTRARVPVIKGKYVYANNPYSLDGSLDFDICFSNEIAVVNSALLTEYTLVDERVKVFLLTIKAWAKLYKISSAADARISSYAWVNLGIFYLQCIGFVPNLQCQELMALHRFTRDPQNWSHCANDLNTCFMPWDIVAAENHWKQSEEVKDTPVTLLVYGFLHFYTKYFPKAMFAVSMRQGSVALPKATFAKAGVETLCIEDPFETHSSHTPHDLGKPAGEAGHVVIAKTLAESEAFLRGFLAGESNDTEGHFWTLSNIAEKPPDSVRNVLYSSPPKKTKRSNRDQQYPAKGRPGGKGGHGNRRLIPREAGNPGVEKSLNGDHQEKKEPRKKRPNNTHQIKAAMLPPNDNGVKYVAPNNEFQNTATKEKQSIQPKGRRSGLHSRHSKKGAPTEGRKDDTRSPIQEKNDNDGNKSAPSDGKESPGLNGHREGKGGRGGGRRRRYAGKKKTNEGKDNDSKDSNMVDSPTHELSKNPGNIIL